MHTVLSVILKRLRVLSDLEVEETEYTRNLIASLRASHSCPGPTGRSPDDVWAADVQAWTPEQMIDSICEKYVRMKYIDTAVEALGGSDSVNALPSKLTSGS